MNKRIGKLKDILNSEAKTITAAAIVIGATSLASRVLGMFRDRILASEFGAGNTLDAYYAAFRIPDLVYNLLVLGALSAGLIPVFSAYLAKNKQDDAWEVFNSVLNIVFVALMIVCGILALISPWLIPLITPGFSGEKIDLTIAMSRIMFLSPIFLGLSGVFGSILQSFKRFFVYSLAPIMYNLGIIFGALFLVKWFGPLGLAWGVVLGAAAHFIVQLFGLSGLNYNYRRIFNWRHAGVKEIGLLMVPRVIGLSISQLSLLVITIAASTLAAGSLSIFSFANNLQSFPLGLFAISFAVASLPLLSQLAAQDKTREFVQSFSATLRQILFFVIPISISMFVLRAQIVRVVLGAGQFDWSATRLTAAVLGLFSLSLFAQALVPLVARAFYAYHDTKKPLVVGFISEAVNILGIIIFIKLLASNNFLTFFLRDWLKVGDLTDIRVFGLIIGFGLSNFVNLILLLYYLRKKIGFLDGKKIWSATWRIVMASLGSGLAVFYSLRLVNNFISLETFGGVLSQLVISGLIGVVVYFGLGIALNSEEIAVFFNAWQKKILRAVKFEKTGSGEAGG